MSLYPRQNTDIRPQKWSLTSLLGVLTIGLFVGGWVKGYFQEHLFWITEGPTAVWLTTHKSYILVAPRLSDNSSSVREGLSSPRKCLYCLVLRCLHLSDSPKSCESLSFFQVGMFQSEEVHARQAKIHNKIITEWLVGRLKTTDVTYRWQVMTSMAEEECSREEQIWNRVIS